MAWRRGLSTSPLRPARHCLEVEEMRLKMYVPFYFTFSDFDDLDLRDAVEELAFEAANRDFHYGDELEGFDLKVIFNNVYETRLKFLQSGVELVPTVSIVEDEGIPF